MLLLLLSLMFGSGSWFRQIPQRTGPNQTSASLPLTIYVFTGQGSQEASMVRDLYNSSPAAHAVWEGADALMSF